MLIRVSQSKAAHYRFWNRLSAYMLAS